ncbi:hypothetical protein DICPUDRAFT_96528 [Dictyostelium purpureum]|uniref:Transmembrane protein n=1 Tax=Dictyostelium purpureum TaxID=5786 RepID=F0Z928_DICPU|nr:uncharacterized protein DICPUDRAFT_96528 [Dictyostelium purpureum]EGC39557.1 hypothetical protein DICPUDRAFT_96528 [Dictyostelium purpureum]|eukprot:XP_003283892.1 hypothetical protein DICPUDRAFT_96528 [Dictyostelium purpureum]
MKLLYVLFILYFFVINLSNIKASKGGVNTSNSSEDELTINIVVDQFSKIPYNYTECGAPSLPCTNFEDAGTSARYLLNNNKDSSIPINLVIELRNSFFYLNNTSSCFGNLYGFCNIKIKSNSGDDKVTIDGTDYFTDQPLFVIEQPQINKPPKYTCGYIKIDINNFSFTNFYLSSSSPLFSVFAQLPNQLYSYLYFNVYNSKFSNINSPIISLENDTPFNNNNNNNKNNNKLQSNLNPNNYNMVTLFSTCSFNNIKRMGDYITVPTPIFKIKSAIIQILLSTISDVTFSSKDPQFIYVENGNLKIFQTTFKNIHSSSSLPFITTLESAFNTQLDTITFQDNSVGTFLEMNQTAPLNTTTEMDYIFLTDSSFSNNIFKSLYDNNNFIVINSNNPHNNLVLNGVQFYKNKLLGSDIIPSTDSSESSSSSQKDISKNKLVSTSSLINLQGPNNYKLLTVEFRDTLESIFLLYLGQTNVSMVNSILLSVDPAGGVGSNITFDSLSFIAQTDTLYQCTGCLFNGKVGIKPPLISTSTAILLILGFLVTIGVLGVLYSKFVHKKLTESIGGRIRRYKEKRFIHLDKNIASTLEQSESLLSDYDDDSSYSINNNNNNNNNNSAINDDYNKFKVVGDLE